MDGGPRSEKEMDNKHHRTLATMISLFMAFLMGGGFLLLLSSCATVPTEPLASGEVRLLSMEVSQKERLGERLPFVLTIVFEADGNPEIVRACISWSRRGPYCSKVKDVIYGTPGTVRIQLLPKNSGPFLLEGYLVYLKDGKTETTNVVNTNIRVFPQE